MNKLMSALTSIFVFSLFLSPSPAHASKSIGLSIRSGSVPGAIGAMGLTPSPGSKIGLSLAAPNLDGSLVLPQAAPDLMIPAADSPPAMREAILAGAFTQPIAAPVTVHRKRPTVVYVDTSGMQDSLRDEMPDHVRDNAPPEDFPNRQDHVRPSMPDDLREHLEKLSAGGSGKMFDGKRSSRRRLPTDDEISDRDLEDFDERLLDDFPADFSMRDFYRLRLRRRWIQP